ncbi:MAG: sugar ABC transporter ATP-binding protein [Chloroflexi bacterium]|nr:sugar ABC transporter ATP-binding protein [Chloroflexota bacterium]MCC6895339.1 sugar ABC transporter ATP-binding protein [Anaerolineae bacterium]
MTPILELENISKSFPGVKALNDVRFSIEAGEVHALLGENGAGKSTLIKIISGVHKPDTGVIRWEGQPVVFNNPREAQAHGVATIYQELSLYPELTVAENIFMGHAPKRSIGPLKIVDWNTINARALELLHSLNIHDMDVRRKVGTLNVGNRQRVEIAKALSINARVLIMDEPTAALTEADVERLFGIVRILKQRGVAIIYISHRLQEVFELADRVTVLRDGHYVNTKPVSETREPELVSMMVGRTIDNLFPKLDSSPGKTVLEVRNLNRGATTQNVSFTVRAGEIVGMAGLVGSGRSETAQTIFGITPAESGEIIVDGQKVSINDPGKAVKLGIAYVPEDRGTQGLIKQMNIRENASLAVLKALSRASFINFGGERKLATDAIKQMSIRAYSAEQIVNKLSGGNQQKVVISKWLASKPKLLIMDEPTRGIDVGAKSEIHRLMSELAVQQGLAILMISSELPEVLGMSDRVLVMREGHIAAEFTRKEATQERVVTAMMSEAAKVE